MIIKCNKPIQSIVSSPKDAEKEILNESAPDKKNQSSEPNSINSNTESIDTKESKNDQALSPPPKEQGNQEAAKEDKTNSPEK